MSRIRGTTLLHNDSLIKGRKIILKMYLIVMGIDIKES